VSVCDEVLWWVCEVVGIIVVFVELLFEYCCFGEHVFGMLLFVALFM